MTRLTLCNMYFRGMKSDNYAISLRLTVTNIKSFFVFGKYHLTYIKNSGI